MTIKAWEGPSTVNGATVMLGVSCEERPSKNKKTGPMVQVSVLVKDEHPVEAVRSGADVAVCEFCPLRPKLHREAKKKGEEVAKHPCYLLPYRMSAQYKALLPMEMDFEGAMDALAGRDVRFGSYGNGSSVPRDVLEPLLKVVGMRTKYEHDWRNPDNQWMAKYAMASVHSLEEREEARALGFRTFRTGDDVGEGEILCLFDSHKIQCVDCGLCNGSNALEDGVVDWGREPRKDIVIPSHK